MIDLKVGKIGWYVTTSVFEQSYLGSNVVANTTLDGFPCLIAALDSPALIDFF